MLGTFSGKCQNRERIAERGKRFAHDEQGVLLDVDDPLMSGNPAVRRRAHVNQQPDTQFAASWADVHVQAIVGSNTGTCIGRGGNVLSDVEFSPFGLPRNANAA